MKGFFDMNRAFWQAMGKAVDLLALSILWLLGCLPVVTILTSTVSLYHTVVKCVRFDQGHFFSEFKDAYRKNLKQGVLLTLLFGVPGGAIGYLDYWLVAISQNRSGAMLILTFGALVLTVLYLSNLFWSIPVFSRFSNTFGNLLKLNYVLAVRQLWRSFLLLLMLMAAMIVFLAVNEFIILLPALTALTGSFLTEKPMYRYMPEQQEDGDWRYGDV